MTKPLPPKPPPLRTIRGNVEEDRPVKHKTVETVIKEKAEELKRLRTLKRNLESGIVFDVSPKLMEILMTSKTEDL